MKKLIVLICILSTVSCAELQSVAETVMENPQQISESQIGSALKQALQNGIDHQVTKLTSENGFYNNEMVKILLPEELQKVDNTLRRIGLGDLADEGLKLLNRAAEDAVNEATPIFVDAVKDMSFADAKSILMGDNRAATQYLEQKTSEQLYQKFYPQVEQSLGKVGADQIWATAISKYNTLPLTEDVETNLSAYVTQQALEGVFTMIAVEEAKIRTNLQSRTTDLLKKVFALQD
ncbi:DUF4197 domain-containing protein [Flavobacteriaceae bacterium 14752]|uniref:DUF4197 domain-containing protein n=1 Tax=Mesohalobacter salilacus TaxID=2491711 RepID=UPI000F63F522|nr:DUF4197 domain-containing protein [Flavobacteriaceae bacterium 14752]